MAILVPGVNVVRLDPLDQLEKVASQATRGHQVHKDHVVCKDSKASAVKEDLKVQLDRLAHQDDRARMAPVVFGDLADHLEREVHLDLKEKEAHKEKGVSRVLKVKLENKVNLDHQAQLVNQDFRARLDQLVHKEIEVQSDRKVHKETLEHLVNPAYP